MYSRMPALEALRTGFAKHKPFAGRGVLLHMHLTPETISLGDALHLGGAQIIYYPSNRDPSSPDAILYAQEHGILIEDMGKLESLSNSHILSNTFYVIEGNGRFFTTLHKGELFGFFRRIAGVSEHTSGGGRLVDAYDLSQLRVPIVAVYRNTLKAYLETGLGTSQTAIAALLRGLGQPLAGRHVTVIGFGNVGRGVARMLRSLGARVAIVEKLQERCLIAHLEGFWVSSLTQALKSSDICVTTTGMPSVITKRHLEDAKEGIILTTLGNQPNEINTRGCKSHEVKRKHLVAWTTPSGKFFHVLGGGIQVNHVIEKGNPSELMDLSFSMHALSLQWLIEETPPAQLYNVPAHIIAKISALVMRTTL